MTQPTVLITGGAGFLGGHLCRFLLARGFAVRSLDVRSFEHAERAGVDVMQGDIRDPVAVAHAMRGVSAVVHAARAASSSPEEIFATGVAGTWTVLQTALRSRVSRFVFLSSAAVYGAQAHRLMHEGDPLHGTGPQAEAKIEAEHLCEGARLNGLPISILRLTDITGPGQGGALAKLFQRALAGHSLLTLGAGRNPYQILDVEDACEAIHLCLVMRQDLVNDTFNLGARAFDNVHDSFQAILKRAGHGKHVIALPQRAASTAIHILERRWSSLRYAWILETAGQDSYLSVRRIDGKLGFQPRYSGTEALLREYDRYARLRGPMGGKVAGQPNCPAPYEQVSAAVGEASIRRLSRLLRGGIH